MVDAVGVIKVNSVVQIDPEHDPVFGGCLMVVTEVRSWGFQGYVTVPGRDDQKGDAYYRVPAEKCEYVGEAVWTHE